MHVRNTVYPLVLWGYSWVESKVIFKSVKACQAKNLDRKKPNIILLVTDDQVKFGHLKGHLRSNSGYFNEIRRCYGKNSTPHCWRWNKIQKCFYNNANMLSFKVNFLEKFQKFSKKNSNFFQWLSNFNDAN